MSQMIASMVGKKILGETAKNHFGKDDPYFERVPATELHKSPSSNKVKKRKKQHPRGMSDHDIKIFNRAKRRAYRLDESLFNCCGIRFGWSSVIGFIPVAGDIIDAFLAYTYVILPCRKFDGGLPSSLQRRMELNIVLDFLVGLVPLLGDIADALYRCNTRNVILLEKHFEKMALAKAEKQAEEGMAGGGGGRIDRDDRLYQNSANRSRDPSRDPSREPPRRPDPVQTQVETRGGRSWFGGSRSGGGGDTAARVDPGLERGETPAPAQPPRPSNGKLQRDPSRREGSRRN